MSATLSHEAVESWVEGYEVAWRTAGTGRLERLFEAGATYRMSPYDERAARGLEEIAALWEREREGPDEEFSLRHEIVAVEGDTAVVRVEVEYPAQDLGYRDLWIVRFGPDGRCSEFEEWPFWPGQQVVAERGERG